jgi:hypothetical protein
MAFGKNSLNNSRINKISQKILVVELRSMKLKIEKVRVCAM